VLKDASTVIEATGLRQIVESDPELMGGTKAITDPELVEGLDEAAQLMLEESGAVDRLLTEGTELPNAGGVIRSFVAESTETYYRVFSDKPFGGFLTKTPPTSSAGAREALALPPGNQATYIQEVIVPAGTRLQRSRALPNFGGRGGGEQFQLLDQLPFKNFGPPKRLQ